MTSTRPSPPSSIRQPISPQELRDYLQSTGQTSGGRNTHVDTLSTLTGPETERVDYLKRVLDCPFTVTDSFSALVTFTQDKITRKTADSLDKLRASMVKRHYTYAANLQGDKLSREAIAALGPGCRCFITEILFHGRTAVLHSVKGYGLDKILNDVGRFDLPTGKPGVFFRFLWDGTPRLGSRDVSFISTLGRTPSVINPVLALVKLGLFTLTPTISPLYSKKTWVLKIIGSKINDDVMPFLRDMHTEGYTLKMAKMLTRDDLHSARAIKRKYRDYRAYVASKGVVLKRDILSG